MKYPVLRLGLLLLLVPLLFGCELKPEDKWPVITSWDWTADLTVTAAINSSTGLITVTPPDGKIKVHTQIRTYNVNQQFTAKVILTKLSKEFTLINATTGSLTSGTDVFPFSTGGGPSSDPRVTFEKTGIVGTLVANSGHPPQGEVIVDFFFVAPWVALGVQDWYSQPDPTNPNIIQLTTLYVYDFMVIMEDMGGRNATFNFEVYSSLAM